MLMEATGRSRQRALGGPASETASSASLQIQPNLLLPYADLDILGVIG